MTLADQVAMLEERGGGYMPTSKSVDWETPPALFDALDKEFGPFTCDPACNGYEHSAIIVGDRGGVLCVAPRQNAIIVAHKDARVYTDGLLADWQGVVYLNPPYGRQIPAWIAKAVSEVEAGNCERVVALIPARTDTKMWQTYILRQAWHERGGWDDFYWEGHKLLLRVRFLPGRVKFVGAKGPAPFPSAVVVWKR